MSTGHKTWVCSEPFRNVCANTFRSDRYLARRRNACMSSNNWSISTNSGITPDYHASGGKCSALVQLLRSDMQALLSSTDKD
jgi:hypothetical protein